jgi:hypothetical protein
MMRIGDNDELNEVLLAVNIEAVGFERGESSYSFFECSPILEG